MINNKIMIKSKFRKMLINNNMINKMDNNKLVVLHSINLVKWISNNLIFKNKNKI
jgi:hypothetical protein